MSESRLMLSNAEVEKLEACGPHEGYIRFGDDVVKLSQDRLLAIYEVAFKDAMHRACQQAGIVNGTDLADWSVEQPAPGQQWVRVTVEDRKGRRTSAVGMVPDPRAH